MKADAQENLKSSCFSSYLIFSYISYLNWNNETIVKSLNVHVRLYILITHVLLNNFLSRFKKKSFDMFLTGMLFTESEFLFIPKYFFSLYFPYRFVIKELIPFFFFFCLSEKVFFFWTVVTDGTKLVIKFPSVMGAKSRKRGGSSQRNPWPRLFSMESRENQRSIIFESDQWLNQLLRVPEDLEDKTEV